MTAKKDEVTKNLANAIMKLRADVDSLYKECELFQRSVDPAIANLSNSVTNHGHKIGGIVTQLKKLSPDNWEKDFAENRISDIESNIKWLFGLNFVFVVLIMTIALVAT